VLHEQIGLVGSYDYRLVTLSVVIAICASFTALDLAGRVTAARGRTRGIWLFGGAAAMGLGIWSMHYIGMLAFSLPVVVQYDWPTVLLSLVAAIFASAVALYVVSRSKMGAWRAVAGSIAMGAGIATMHYTGMEAMRLTAMCEYNPWLVALSVVLAIVISFVALWLSFLAREERTGSSVRKMVSAVVMGAAIPVMHYTGMVAARFMPTDAVPDLSHAVSISALGTMGITTVTLLVLGFAILTSLFDRRYSAQTLELESVGQRYKLLFERSLAGVIRTSTDGAILDCNPACARMFGFASPAELMATSIADRYFDPEDYNAFLAKLKEEKSLTNHEHCLRRKDGNPVWLLGSANLVEDKDGVASVNEETLIDITERKKADETFRKAFNANPEPMTIATITEGRYLDVNDSFLKITGYRREEVIGRTSLQINFWDRPEPRAEQVSMLRKSGSVRDLPITFKTKSGQQRIALDSSEIIEVAGQKCMISILRDMTEQRQLETQLRQSQKMEAIGQLSGGIAHDFNNLLSVIIGYSEMLEARIPTNDPLWKKCEQITKAGRSAAALTQQLLAFSRQQVLEAKILDLNQVVQQMEKMLRRLIGEDIEFATMLDPATGRITVDQGQIEQVIMNLAVNARDAMPNGGKLTIETANINVDEDYALRHPPQQPGPYVMLTVSDTGIGMNSETQARIFDPFFTTKELGKGTGLGLSTVYGVVRQSGGHVWVYSEPGHGSTFKVYLPRTQSDVGADRTNPQTSQQNASETILLVEDADALRQLTRELLEEGGYTVLEANRPETAIQIAANHRGEIALMLTDMVMPGMDGRALAKRLSIQRPEMRVVFMSGYTGFSHSRLIEPGLTFLAKPFSKDTLLHKLREALTASEDLNLLRLS